MVNIAVNSGLKLRPLKLRLLTTTQGKKTPYVQCKKLRYEVQTVLIPLILLHSTETFSGNILANLYINIPSI
jgi:hypothetical protein